MFLFKRGNIYYIEYTDPRTKKRKRQSTKEKSKDKAYNFAVSFLPQKVIGHQKLNDAGLTNQITLTDYKDEYCKFAEGMYSVKYVRSIKLSFREMLKVISNKNLRDITTREIDHFLMGKYRSSKYAAHMYLRTLKAAFNKAINWGYLDKNPFVKIKLPKPPRNNPVFISESELQTIISKTKEPDMKDIFLVAFYTGMRLGEIVNLRSEQIDLSEQMIHLSNNENFQNKSKQERIIPIAKQIQMLLSERIKTKKDYIFTKTRNIRYNEDYVSKKFKSAVQNTTLSDSIHFHTLRHSFASNLVKKGASLYVVKELLGHQSITTTQIYSHLEQNTLMEAINKL